MFVIWIILAPELSNNDITAVFKHHFSVQMSQCFFLSHFPLSSNKMFFVPLNYKLHFCPFRTN